MFSINKFVLTFVTSAQWDDKVNIQKLDGIALINNFQSHTWAASVMTVSEYNFLFSLEGRLSTIVTTDFDSLLDFKEYKAIVLSVDGTQAGINMVGVNMSFLIRV